MPPAATRPATASPISRPPRNVRMIYLSPKMGKKDRLLREWPRLQFRLLPHDDLGADGHALVEVGDIGIDQPEAAGRNLGADRLRPVGAVDTGDGGPEIHRPRPERVTRAAGHEARQIWLALDHLRRRCPVRPFRLARDVLEYLPLG